ncbi:hypothetical protein PBRA_007670 [Plasmodiophora brassicae]|uniref:Uncharacterized protein n=1 Tax=Plasmodiophora brassicae TaxID=37360 RepID=A0A0G4IXY7_PLABS|nr:hypothetical protein PBRA_007670 [Plasmodiophora brassicae]
MASQFTKLIVGRSIAKSVLESSAEVVQKTARAAPKFIRDDGAIGVDRRAAQTGFNHVSKATGPPAPHTAPEMTRDTQWPPLL